MRLRHLRCGKAFAFPQWALNFGVDPGKAQSFRIGCGQAARCETPEQLRRTYFQLTENKYIPIQILNLKLPVPIRLLPQGHQYSHAFSDLSVKLLNVSYSNVSIPHAAAPLRIMIRLLVSFDSLQHDLDSIANQNAEHVWRVFGKRMTGESKIALIPLEGLIDIRDWETCSYASEVNHATD